MTEASRSADVTVVIATYNRAHYIRYSVDSLLNQTRVPRQIIIVDDGSTDNTKSVLEGYADRITVFHQSNGGKAKALNSVLDLVETRFLWFFDDDDIALPCAIEHLLDPYYRRTELGFTFGARYGAYGEGNLSIDQSKLRGYPFGELSEQHQRLELYRECTIMMSASLIRTEAVRRIGGLDERLVRAQDYDLMLRLASEFPFEFCGEPVYILRRHDGVRGTAQSSHQASHKANQWACFNEAIGHYLRYELAVSAFCWRQEMPYQDASERREHLIIRAWTTANKLPPSYALNDLAEAFTLAPESPLNVREVRWLNELFNHEYTLFLGRPGLLGLARLMSTAAGADALRELSKGIYWLARGEMRGRRRWMRYGFAVTVYFQGMIAGYFHKYLRKMSFS